MISGQLFVGEGEQYRSLSSSADKLYPIDTVNGPEYWLRKSLTQIQKVRQKTFHRYFLPNDGKTVDAQYQD